jgi:hypothetical protein
VFTAWLVDVKGQGSQHRGLGPAGVTPDNILAQMHRGLAEPGTEKP